MTRKKSALPGQRQLRVGEELRHALAAILAEDHLNDPDLKGRALTVTEIRVSPDLTNATAFVVPLYGQGDGAQAERTLAALNRATAYFRGKLSNAVNLRISPRIKFRLDETFERVHRIETLLRDPVVARDIETGQREKSDDGA